MSPVVQVIIDMVYFGLEKFGRYYSDYPAYIHDNKDPLNLHRVRLIIPGIADTPMDSWSWPKGLYSGRTYGAHCIPPEGTMVWVSFRLGDPNHPLWFGGHFGQDDVVNWTPKQKRYNNHWFQTPQGNLVELDDEDGTIRLTDVQGNIIQTSSKGISVVPAKGKNIYHGSIDTGKEPHAMGKTTQGVANSHNDIQNSFIGSVQKMTVDIQTMMVGVSAAKSPILAAAVLLKTAPDLVISSKSLITDSNKLSNSLSKIGKDQIPNMTSNKAFLDKD